MFTYSHANTPLDQSEREYYVSLFYKAEQLSRHSERQETRSFSSIESGS